jgi:hypothetical protein
VAFGDAPARSPAKRLAERLLYAAHSARGPSFDRQPVKDALIDVARDTQAPVAALVHLFLRGGG